MYVTCTWYYTILIHDYVQLISHFLSDRFLLSLVFFADFYDDWFLCDPASRIVVAGSLFRCRHHCDPLFLLLSLTRSFTADDGDSASGAAGCCRFAQQVQHLWRSVAEKLRNRSIAQQFWSLSPSSQLLYNISSLHVCPPCISFLLYLYT